jgi:hypothetical protein
LYDAQEFLRRAGKNFYPRQNIGGDKVIADLTDAATWIRIFDRSQMMPIWISSPALLTPRTGWLILLIEQIKPTPGPSTRIARVP